MRKKTEHGTDRELRRLLRRGDPALQGGLDPAETARMRRQAVAAAHRPAPGRPPLLRPLGYAAAALVVLLAGWLAVQKLPETVPLPAAPRAPAPAVADPSSPLVPQVAVPAPVIAASGASAPRREPVEPAVAPPAERREPRQMQFVTSGGTRVIWTLNPDLDLGPSPAPGKGAKS